MAASNQIFARPRQRGDWVTGRGTGRVGQTIAGGPADDHTGHGPRIPVQGGRSRVRRPPADGLRLAAGRARDPIGRAAENHRTAQRTRRDGGHARALRLLEQWRAAPHRTAARTPPWPGSTASGPSAARAERDRSDARRTPRGGIASTGRCAPRGPRAVSVERARARRERASYDGTKGPSNPRPARSARKPRRCPTGCRVAAAPRVRRSREAGPCRVVPCRVS